MAKRKTKGKAEADNSKALWKAYRDLHKKAESAWHKLRDDVRKDAGPSVLLKDRNRLLLILGECNYMARECSRMANKKMR